MIYWAIAFFIIALVVALFGFTGIASGAAIIAQMLFFIFLVLFVIALTLSFVYGAGARADRWDEA